MADKLYLSIWKDCETCKGTGRIKSRAEFFIDASGNRIECTHCPLCSGKGKQPTFIPLKELTVLVRHSSEFGGYYQNEPLKLQEAIEEWMEKKDGKEKEKSNKKKRS